MFHSILAVYDTKDWLTSEYKQGAVDRVLFKEGVLSESEYL